MKSSTRKSRPKNNGNMSSAVATPRRKDEDGITFRNLLDGIESWSSYNRVASEEGSHLGQLGFGSGRRMRKRRRLEKGDDGGGMALNVDSKSVSGSHVNGSDSNKRTEGVRLGSVFVPTTEDALSSVQRSLRDAEDGRSTNAATFDTSAIDDTAAADTNTDADGAYFASSPPLKLKWTRLHPSTFYRASATVQMGTHDADLIPKLKHTHPHPYQSIPLQSSLIIDHCQKSRPRPYSHANQHHHQSGIQADHTTNDKDYNVFHNDNMNFIEPPNVEINLTRLIDPPLLSSWIPGIDPRITYNDDDKMNNNTSNDETHSHPDDATETVQSVLNTILQPKAYNTHKAHNNRTLSFPPDIIRSMLRVDGTMYQRLLPSHLFLHRIHKIQKILHNGDTIIVAPDGNTPKTETATKTTILEVGLSTLTSLTTVCPSEALGTHVLRILAPALFGVPSSSTVATDDLPPRRSVGDSKKEEEGDLPRVATRVRELAVQLVYGCHLGRRKKEQLRTMVRGLQGLSDVANLFVKDITEAYFDYRRKKCHVKPLASDRS